MGRAYENNLGFLRAGDAQISQAKVKLYFFLICAKYSVILLTL
jgi:hypothetical protein